MLHAQVVPGQLAVVADGGQGNGVSVDVDGALGELRLASNAYPHLACVNCAALSARFEVPVAQGAVALGRQVRAQLGASVRVSAHLQQCVGHGVLQCDGNRQAVHVVELEVNAHGLVRLDQAVQDVDCAQQAVVVARSGGYVRLAAQQERSHVVVARVSCKDLAQQLCGAVRVDKELLQADQEADGVPSADPGAEVAVPLPVR